MIPSVLHATVFIMSYRRPYIYFGGKTFHDECGKIYFTKVYVIKHIAVETSYVSQSYITRKPMYIYSVE